MKTNNYCKVREDLIDSELLIPIGNTYYTGNKEFKYRWKPNDQFQVLYKNKWQDAESVDFNFYCKFK